MEKANAGPVMGRIEVQNLPHLEREQTSTRCLITRKFAEFSKGVKQMNTKVCATPDDIRQKTVNAYRKGLSGTMTNRFC